MLFGDITYLCWDENCQKNLLISLALARTEKRIATRPKQIVISTTKYLWGNTERAIFFGGDGQELTKGFKY